MTDKWANAKSNKKSIQKPPKIIKDRVWDHPGGSRGRLGDQFGPRAAQGSKRAPKRCEILVCFWHQNGDLVQLFVVFFLVFFEVLALHVFHDFWWFLDGLLVAFCVRPLVCRHVFLQLFWDFFLVDFGVPPLVCQITKIKSTVAG